MGKASRRQVLSALGWVSGAIALPGCGGNALSQTPGEQTAVWQYAALSPAAISTEAYRLMPDGGCMYGVFRAIVAGWLAKAGRPADSFPFHMMRYGEGGIAGWGTICGALNAGAAVIGLFEKEKARREAIIAALFSWYEQTDLPVYRPEGSDPPRIVKSAARSVLCHVSVAHWCKASGAALLSPQMKERCRRLTADVAGKTVELLNRSLEAAPETWGIGQKTVASKEAPQAIGKMDCSACHQPPDQDP